MLNWTELYHNRIFLSEPLGYALPTCHFIFYIRVLKRNIYHQEKKHLYVGTVNPVYTGHSMEVEMWPL